MSQLGEAGDLGGARAYAAIVRTRVVALVLAAGLAAPLGVVLATHAHAQSAAPDLTTVALPLDLRGGIEASSEHGCSQSFASSSSRTALRLAVGARGAATLTVDLESHETFGPSPGRYAEGDRDFTRTTELARAVLHGQATRSGADVVIRFDRAERASVTFTGYGTLPLPPATTASITATMRCTIAAVDLLPAEPSDGEQPTRSSLLECTFDAPIPPLDRFEGAALVLGRGEGVRVVSERHVWDHATRRTIRRAR